MRSQESGAGKCHHHNQTMFTLQCLITSKKQLNNIFFCSLGEKWGSEGGGGVRTHVGYSLLRSL